jgi:hypothetical protein
MANPYDNADRLRAAGMVVGRHMDIPAARDFGKKARDVADNARRLTGKDTDAVTCGIVGEISDSFLRDGTTHAEIEAIAEAFSSMQITCEIRRDLLSFIVGVGITQAQSPAVQETGDSKGGVLSIVSRGLSKQEFEAIIAQTEENERELRRCHSAVRHADTGSARLTAQEALDAARVEGDEIAGVFNHFFFRSMGGNATPSPDAVMVE